MNAIRPGDEGYQRGDLLRAAHPPVKLPRRHRRTRGRGVGRALIEASADVARERGAAWLEWATAPDNHTAQRLYDSMTSEKSTWLEYELDV